MDITRETVFQYQFVPVHPLSTGHYFDISALPHRISWYRFSPGTINERRGQVTIERCNNCEITIVADNKNVTRAGAPIEYYKSPFDTEPLLEWYCHYCNDRGYSYRNDLSYCERCDRHINDTAGNGLRPYFISDPEDNHITCCVSCAQAFYLENGHTIEQVRSGKIHCDFYTWSELESKGWTEGETFNGRLLANTGAKAWQDYCMQMINNGYIVLTDQGTTGLGNDYPDTVTVWYKRAE